MKRISRYFGFLRDKKRRTYYKDIDCIYPIEEIAKKLIEDKENIYSPEIIEYLIKNHLGELEYTYLSENYADQMIFSRTKELGAETSYIFLPRIDFINAVESAYKDGEISFLTYQKQNI